MWYNVPKGQKGTAMPNRQLREWIEDFLGYLADVRGYSEATVETYEIALWQMAKYSHLYEEGGATVLDITPFRFEIVKNNKKTIVKKLSAIRSLVNYLEDQCRLTVRVIGIESIKTPQNLPKPIEERYITEVLESATIEERLIIMMLYGLGLRISELSTLKLSQIKPGWIEVIGKGSKSREIPLLPSLSRLIKTYRREYTPQKYLLEKAKCPLSTAQIRYKVTKRFKAAGIKATPHQLRHSFATHLLNNGARIADVSELLGHETMATTQVYTKLGSVKKMQEYMRAHPLVKGSDER